MHSEDTEASDGDDDRQADLGEFGTAGDGAGDGDDLQELVTLVDQLADNQRTLVTAIQDIADHVDDDPDSDDGDGDGDPDESTPIRGFQ